MHNSPGILTCCITGSVLNCEFQYGGVLQDRGLNYQDSWSEEIGPCLRAVSEQVVDNFGIVNLDVAASSALVQQRQDRSINGLNIEKAIVNRCSRGFVGTGPLQINTSVCEMPFTHPKSLTSVSTR